MDKRILFCILILTIIGCETTGDPRQGGLFGWSEKKAADRQVALTGTLTEEERNAQLARERTMALQNDRAAKLAELDTQRKRLGELDTELAKMRKQVDKIKVSTAAKQKEKQGIQKDIDKLNNKIGVLQRNTGLSVQDRKRKIGGLNDEIEKLLEAISNL